MSHYSVAVFTDENTCVEDLLEQYDENLKVDKYVYKTKKEMIQSGKEEIKSHLNVFKIYMKDKRAFRRKHKNNLRYLRFIKKVPSMKKWDNEKIYKYSIRYYGDEEIGENGELCSTYNPNSKWDWYTIGGRWKDMLIIEDGIKTNSALVKDIRWDLIEKENEKYIIPYEDYVKQSIYSKEYLKELYPSKEEYIKQNLIFTTYAVVMPNGEWLEPGRMGWWGISQASASEEREFNNNYIKNILSKVDENWQLTIVDCHI